MESRTEKSERLEILKEAGKAAINAGTFTKAIVAIGPIWERLIAEGNRNSANDVGFLIERLFEAQYDPDITFVQFVAEFKKGLAAIEAALSSELSADEDGSSRIH